MLYPRLEKARVRLDALKAGKASLSAGEWLATWWSAREDAPPFAVLSRLDAELNRVGLHTSADVKLLRGLKLEKGRAAALAQGLRARVVEAVEEVERALARAARRRGALAPQEAEYFEGAYRKLARAVRVADLFASGRERTGDDLSFTFLSSPPMPARPPSKAVVAIAEYWATRARQNLDDWQRKRRDLDAAHELLLRVEVGEDRARVRQLRTEVAQRRESLRQAGESRTLRDWVRRVREAPQGRYEALRVLYEAAVLAQDAELAEVAYRAASALLPPVERLRPLVEAAELEPLHAWSRQRELPPRPKGADERLVDLAFDLEDAHLPALELALGCARYFNIEDALAEEVLAASEDRPRQRRVPYPTQTMTYDQTGSLDDVAHFVLTQPGMVVYDLASHRQLVRAYLEDEPSQSRPRAKRTAVRVYVCDASGSMHGARARFRDAILIAELHSLRVKAEQGAPFDPLYFSFFNDVPTSLARVDTAAEAARQMEKLFRRSPAEGQTDITLALMSAFNSIQSARGKDPHLARATVVLVTDGEDRVDLELIRKVRAPLGSVEIALSFISLGDENADLRALVLEQREEGRRAFYHHLSDGELSAARTEFDTTWRTLLPAQVPDAEDALVRLLPHLEALEAVAAGRAAPERALSPWEFDALFPAGQGGGAGRVAPEVDRCADVVSAMVEALAFAPPSQRAGEAVELLRHLLAQYEIPLPRYLEAVNAPPEALASALERIRLLCRPGGGRRR